MLRKLVNTMQGKTKHRNVEEERSQCIATRIGASKLTNNDTSVLEIAE